MSACGGKLKFSTQPLAESVAARFMAQKPKAGRRWAYQCEACGCWHLSSMSPRRQRAVERRAPAASPPVEPGTAKETT